MDIRTISSHNFIPVIDPTFLKQSPDEFLAENGGFLSEVAVIAKSTTGFVNYRSATAPANRESNEFFSTFSSIADSIGIKVYAVIDGFADSFLAKNTSYSAIKDGGNPNFQFVDPFKSAYTNYLGAIITEILSFPIQGIILDNIRFPREDYSFCESCCRKFSNTYGIERIFSINDLQKNPKLLAHWHQLRAETIESILKELSVSVSKQKNLEFNIILDIDPALKGEKGALAHFGQKIDVFGKYGIPTIHISAWTAYPTSQNTAAFQDILNNLTFAKKYQESAQSKLNLFAWGIENENYLALINAIKEVISLDKIFIQNHYPIDYQKRREIHLGLV